MIFKQVELTHTDTSWKPMGCWFWKIHSQYYIIILSDNINITAQKKDTVLIDKNLENEINRVLEFGHTGDGWNKLKPRFLKSNSTLISLMTTSHSWKEITMF